MNKKATKSSLKENEYDQQEQLSLFGEGMREKGMENKTAVALKLDELEERKIGARELFNHLFEACNILRGPINQDEYKTYVIPILFFKRISDCYDEETELAIQEYGEDVNLFDEDEIHKFRIPNGAHWRDVRETSENVGKAIVDAMNNIERVNPETMAGLFSSFDDVCP